MVKVNRFIGNPILTPRPDVSWEAAASFNGSVIADENAFHMVYRALSLPMRVDGRELQLSTIGHTVGFDRVHFTERNQLIFPEYEWEKFGCEDPRVTKFNGKFFIFYTALSSWPPEAAGIKVAVALTRDFKSIEEKHLVTPFNAKAMAMFPERVKGKIACILTAHTDQPPAKIGIALFEDEREIWDKAYWEHWHNEIDHTVIPLLRSEKDQVEVGAAPVKTKYGWLLIYSYIRNYYTPRERIFGIEAVLLDGENPLRVIGRTDVPLLAPERDYENYGMIPNVIFPSGALVYNNNLGMYYGATDSTVCLATVSLDELLDEIRPGVKSRGVVNKSNSLFVKYKGNPIIEPIPEHAWESRYTLNPAAFYERGKVHILYRAQGDDNVSRVGYASSDNGTHVDYRSPHPVYSPRTDDEKAGCEDPRVTKIGDRLYMCYTAYDAHNPPRVAITSITISDFLLKDWKWDMPTLISQPGVMDKNTCILPEKISGRYVFLHRIEPNIWIDFHSDLEFHDGTWLHGAIVMSPRTVGWDSVKIGIGPPPIKTQDGWLLIYHGISKADNKYRMGAALLDLGNPAKVVARLNEPVLEPESEYQKKGLRPGTVFACGAAVIGETMYMYYGGADQFVCVATANLNKLIEYVKVNGKI